MQLFVEEGLFVGDGLQIDRIVEPAEAFTDSEIVVPYTTTHQWKHYASTQYRGVVPIVAFQVAYGIVTDTTGQLSVVHLVEPEFAVQRSRFNNTAWHTATTQFSRSLIVGLWGCQVVDPGTVEDAFYKQMSADRLAVEGHVQVSVEDTCNERTGPILLSQLAEVFDIFDNGLLLSGDIVDNPLFL